MKKGKYIDALLSLPLDYPLFIDMERNKPINAALDDVRYKPGIISNLEYRLTNDNLGMAISFIQMGNKLSQIRQPYRAKEGRIIRVLQGTGRIFINLIEYEISTRRIIIIPDNSLIEALEISSDYDLRVIMPAYSFLPAMSNFILSETYTGNGTILSLSEEGWTQVELFLVLLWKVFHSSLYHRETVQYLTVSSLCNFKYIHE